MKDRIDAGYARREPFPVTHVIGLLIAKLLLVIMIVGCAGTGSTCVYGGETASPPERKFVSVSAGGEHTCGVGADRDVACWGWDEYGQASPPFG